jgi:DNA invertase Pin-like site-specific DNA recombinase
MQIGYIRVSTAKQAEHGSSLDEQEKAVRDAGAETTYTDAGWSGKNTSRPGLDAMQKALHDGDTVIVSALDRLGRSTADIAQMLHDWKDRQITLIAVRDGINTSTPTGTMMAQIMAVVAEMERTFILERTAAGREAAKASGKIANRPRKWTIKKAKQVAHLKADGWSISEIARTIGVSRDTVRRMIAEAEVEA